MSTGSTPQHDPATTTTSSGGLIHIIADKINHPHDKLHPELLPSARPLESLPITPITTTPTHVKPQLEVHHHEYEGGQQTGLLHTITDKIFHPHDHHEHPLPVHQTPPDFHSITESIPSNIPVQHSAALANHPQHHPDNTSTVVDKLQQHQHQHQHPTSRIPVDDILVVEGRACVIIQDHVVKNSLGDNKDDDAHLADHFQQYRAQPPPHNSSHV